MLRVYDKYGQEQSLAWLHDQFGNVEIDAPPVPLSAVSGRPEDGLKLPSNGGAVADLFEIVELRENDDIHPGQGNEFPAQAPGESAPAVGDDSAQAAGGPIRAPAAIITRVLDENGAPLPGVTCVFWWPDAPALPGSGWHEAGVTGTTEEGGTVGFPMGGGAYYDPREAQGPHHLWVYGRGRSEIIRGLGMIAGTNHRHLDVTFQRCAGGTVPPPEPPPGDAIHAICRAKAAIDQAEVCLAEALAALDGVCPD